MAIYRYLYAVPLLLVYVVGQGAEQPLLTIEEAVARTRDHSLVIFAARAGVAIAEGQVLTAGDRPNPTLNLGAEQFDLSQPNDHLGSDSGVGANRTYTVRIDQQLELGDKRGHRVRTANAQRHVAEAQVGDALRLQTAAAQQSFIAALLSRENLRLAEANLALDDGTERVVRTQVEAGHRPQADLASFTVSRIQARQDALTARLAYDQARADLVTIMGDDINAVLPELSGEIDAKLPNGQLTKPADGDSAVVDNRSDVVAARRQLDQATAALGLARAQRVIDPTVGVEYQRIGDTNTVGFLASTMLPVWNNHGGDIAQAEAQRVQAELQWRQTRRQALVDVQKARQGLASSQLQLDLFGPETMAKANQVLEIVTHSYQDGATSMIELMDARRAFNQVRLASNQAHFIHRMAVTQLGLALGIQSPSER